MPAGPSPPGHGRKQRRHPRQTIGLIQSSRAPLMFLRECSASRSRQPSHAQNGKRKASTAAQQPCPSQPDTEFRTRSPSPATKPRRAIFAHRLPALAAAPAGYGWPARSSAGLERRRRAGRRRAADAADRATPPAASPAPAAPETDPPQPSATGLAFPRRVPPPRPFPGPAGFRQRSKPGPPERRSEPLTLKEAGATAAPN